MSADFWTPARISELRERVGNGESYQSIADSWGVTKNVCIGKGQRIGLGNPKPRPKMLRPDIFPAAGCCVFPIGHPGDANFHFCGERVRAFGAPYCRDHHSLTHVRKSLVPVPEARAAE